MSANLSSNAEASARELRNRLHLLHTDFQNEKQRTFELTADMTRQYKAMKVELLNSINALNDEILKYKDLLSMYHFIARVAKFIIYFLRRRQERDVDARNGK